MQRILFFLLVMSNVLFADTFTHKVTKKTFTGYPTNIKKQNKTLVRTSPGFVARYMNCEDYEIEYNLQGRRGKAIVIYLEGDFSAQAIIDTSKERLDLCANQGPFLIILEFGKIEEGYLLNFKSDMVSNIQEIKNAKIVTIIKEESDPLGEIAASCDKAYYLKDFEKISDVYSQIADDFLLKNFKVVRDRYTAGAQKKYLLTKKKIESLEQEINSYVKAIENYQRMLPGMLSRYKEARDEVALAGAEYVRLRNVVNNGDFVYRERFLFKHAIAIRNMKVLKKRCEKLIEDIGTLNKRIVSQRKKSHFHIAKYPEFQVYSESINIAIDRAEKASKKASDMYKAAK